MVQMEVDLYLRLKDCFILVNTLPDAWHYWVSAGTGWLGVSTL